MSMTLTVRHLGRIEEAVLDIRPLTIFVGPNGTNKTWTAYSLFGVLEALRWVDQGSPQHLRVDAAMERAIETTCAEIQKQIEQLPPGADLRTRIRRDEILTKTGAHELTFTLLAPGVRACIAAEVDPRCNV